MRLVTAVAIVACFLAGETAVLSVEFAEEAKTIRPHGEDAYNEWKNDCRKLSRRIAEEMRTPRRPYSLRRAVRCTDPDRRYDWELDATNLHVVVANAFYHERDEVKQRAIAMLEGADCDHGANCRELSQLLRIHLSGAGMRQSKDWMTRYYDRLRRLERRLN